MAHRRWNAAAVGFPAAKRQRQAELSFTATGKQEPMGEKMLAALGPMLKPTLRPILGSILRHMRKPSRQARGPES
eukprot:899830-Lingulodinium_polyedra.AAC.1